VEYFCHEGDPCHGNADRQGKQAVRLLPAATSVQTAVAQFILHCSKMKK
jgi:hypothetical protein